MNNNDFKLIRHLVKNARATWSELGLLLGLSAPAAADRVRKLEQAGIIKGYSALINPDEVNCGLAAFIAVTLDSTQAKTSFLALVTQSANILECHHIAGAHDYLIKIRCSNTRDLEWIVSQQIKTLPDVKTQTTIVLSTVKETPRLPLQHAEEH